MRAGERKVGGEGLGGEESWRGDGRRGGEGKRSARRKLSQNMGKNSASASKKYSAYDFVPRACSQELDP